MEPAPYRSGSKKRKPTALLEAHGTGGRQPLDVGIQRLLKLSLKRSAHRDVVKEVSDQISAGEDIKLDTTIGTLRNRSVGWIANAMTDINDKDLVKKVCFTLIP